MDKAYRLTFEEEKGRLSLKSVKRLEMRAPPGHGREQLAEKLTGRFVLLRDKKGATLYRRSINGLLPSTVEYPTGDPAQPFGRVEPRRPRIVSIVVPEIPGAQVAALVEMPPGGRRGKAKAKAADAPVELITVNLRDHDKDRSGREPRS